MATTFKDFQSNDLANTRTLLHEAIPVTGSIVSGTYTNTGKTTEENYKTYGHGMFKSVYDYPFLSSSANHIFDITAGYSSLAGISSSVTSQAAKKQNIYNQMAQYLVGYDDTGSIKRFSMPVGHAGGGSAEAPGSFMDDVIIIPFARLLSKDEIKKGSVSLEFGLSGAFSTAGNAFGIRGKLFDYSGSDGYFVDSPAGEYGVLYGTGTANGTNGNGVFNGDSGTTPTMPAVGLVYYQAGVAVISGSLFSAVADGGVLKAFGTGGGNQHGPGSSVLVGTATSRAASGFSTITGSTIDTFTDGVLNRVFNISYNNTTELNSTIYFCRASHADFNYSSNPTYLTGSEIRVKTRPSDTPVSYITTVGLYSADNELLAVAKLSEPLRKDPTNELTLRVRLDY